MKDSKMSQDIVEQLKMTADNLKQIKSVDPSCTCGHIIQVLNDAAIEIEILRREIFRLHGWVKVYENAEL